MDNMSGRRTPDVDLFGPVWDMFIEWISSNHPEDFDRMYDLDYGYPIPGYPILDATSIRLWEQYRRVRRLAAWVLHGVVGQSKL